MKILLKMGKLKNQLDIHINSKNDIQEKLKNIYTENNKVERDNDDLKNELTKTKLNLEKLKDEYEELYHNKQYVFSCYKNEEKILKENLERYKTKCAILENQKDCHILEDKYKQLEIKLKDTENEKYMYERTCLMNEKRQNDMATEIKDLKNELYDCKNRLYKMSKSDVLDMKTTLYNQDILRDKIKDEELNIIKDYLDELHYATQNLYNTNYYNTLCNYKKLGESKQFSVLKCLKTKEGTRKDNIESYHFDHEEKLNNPNYSYYSDQEELNSSQSHHSYNSNNTSNYEHSFPYQSKTTKHPQKNIQNQTKDMKHILFSLNAADEFKKKKKKKKHTHKDEKKEIINFNTKEKNIFHNHKNKEPKNKTKNPNNHTNKTELSNQKTHNFKTQQTEKKYNNIHNYKNQKLKCKIIPDNYNNLSYSQNIKHVNNDLNKSYTFENIIQMTNYKIKDLKDKEDNIKFTNDKEKELFQYLILKAINEIEQISTKLEQKFKDQLINKINYLQEKYEHKVKDLYKFNVSLGIQNEQLLKKDQDNKELIKQLESTKHIMLHQIENLKKNNQIIYDKFLQKDISQNETNDTIEKLNQKLKSEQKQIYHYEQKINTLNDDLNNSYQKYVYYYNKSDSNQNLLQQKEDQIVHLKLLKKKKKKKKLYNQDILRDKIKEKEKDKETFQFNYNNIQSDEKPEHEETSDDPLNVKQKISSIEKQLILLKLEKANKESELIRCPKHGRRSEEIKKKEFIETKLKYLEDKINILNKNLKYMKLKKNEKNNI
ncbi:hypothetical protein PFMC_00609 [Plasmodium falciparum CAMP/Malaysia]|uniref:Uncharacterized protein n=1 Tax=Plasmodium falciparum (isolate Camp / Malaysia) TaxID=5835 RepID=A0A024XDC1_PLAFC|nr:hypothetical protein PFMC_00609 [Plasmodium falciparum CAMP/Malaysia]